MESFPPPDPAALVHQPDDAPFLQPEGGDGRSRWWLWGALALVGVAAVVLGVVLFADRVADGTHPEASSQSTTAESVAASAADTTSSATETTVETTDSREPSTTEAAATSAA